MLAASRFPTRDKDFSVEIFWAGKANKGGRLNERRVVLKKLMTTIFGEESPLHWHRITFDDGIIQCCLLRSKQFLIGKIALWVVDFTRSHSVSIYSCKIKSQRLKFEGEEGKLSSLQIKEQ